MDQPTSDRTTPTPVRCAWCGREIVQDGPGRRRRYCRQSCRQRAYEQRQALAGTSVPTDALILSSTAAEELTDRLFEIRCGAEDIAAAVAEGEDADSVTALCGELVALARRAETIRSRDREEGGVMDADGDKR
ncbi:MAG: hypothetical protein L0J74_03175 [Corynebacterium sp.]|uniref:hypothetical protein n=1 Tax=Corynebacterium TaxID=1716 RepID=UPI002648144A|nr:hypothetical protein [Corynebacterium sp.]MDN5723234.1 hypothetical protein [Corynebacterium sp.]MDN6281321.1 hypothetical protein [Corynebacterium sp.]MDN6304797.1 hypothetical protein [Corynebacterium sp.]MDN6366695.1 hypothetical protein [Corynebacterium sp.]MDN6395297.1 hypothetical protein [Corynebacterium sp.]